jgi:hypothetical protein
VGPQFSAFRNHGRVGAYNLCERVHRRRMAEDLLEPLDGAA